MKKEEQLFIETSNKIFSNDFALFLQIIGKSVNEEQDVAKNTEEIAKKIAEILKGNSLSCCIVALSFHIASIISSEKSILELLDKISQDNSECNKEDKINEYIR